MEIGSFIDLQLPQGNEYYTGDQGIARLNSGRAAIYHAIRVLGCDTVWLPHYQCGTVREFLQKKGIRVRYYSLDAQLFPVDLPSQADEAVVLVNYYGILSGQRMHRLAQQYSNVVIDNSQAFFARPLEGCMNVYSARKFVGVPDGAYVIGENAERYVADYEQGYSSDTALFLLQRVEYGCEGKAYASRTKNEERIDAEDICKMSALTHKILDGTDYEFIRRKRQENFSVACQLFASVNRLDPASYGDAETVPMVYPLAIEKDSLLPLLTENKHFQGHWWQYLLQEMPEDSIEYWLSRYVVPITIDQRYGREELEALSSVVHSRF